MMHTIRWLGLIGLCGWLCAPAWAGGSGNVSVRVVEASQNGTGFSDGLGDVAELLQGNLPFRRYVLLDSGTVRLPGGQLLKMAGGLMIQINGAQNNVSVSVSRSNQTLLNTVVSLEDNRPMILGGIPGGKGKLLIILVAQ